MFMVEIVVYCGTPYNIGTPKILQFCAFYFSFYILAKTLPAVTSSSFLIVLFHRCQTKVTS